MENSVSHLVKNTNGSDYVVGDIHGCFKTLSQALDAVDFNPSYDRLISVGDLVDRGNENMMALHYLNQPWFHAVLGNHEEMHMSQFFDPLGRDGMNWALQLPKEEQIQYLQLVQKMHKLPLLIDVETEYGLVGIVHAEVSPHIRSWERAMDIAFGTEQDKLKDSKLVWGRARSSGNIGSDGRFNDKVSGVSLILCGHNVVDEPTWYGNHLNIDTGAVFGVMGRADLHANAALTLVNLTKRKILNFSTVGSELQNPKVQDLIG